MGLLNMGLLNMGVATARFTWHRYFTEFTAQVLYWLYYTGTLLTYWFYWLYWLTDVTDLTTQVLYWLTDVTDFYYFYFFAALLPPYYTGTLLTLLHRYFTDFAATHFTDLLTLLTFTIFYFSAALCLLTMSVSTARCRTYFFSYSTYLFSPLYYACGDSALP
jgi:hypothetical protein